jgi:hypothetical protein
MITLVETHGLLGSNLNLKKDGKSTTIHIYFEAHEDKEKDRILLNQIINLYNNQFFR